MDKARMLGQMLRAWVSHEEAEPMHEGATPPSKEWAASEQREHKGKKGKAWAEEEAVEVLGKGAARKAGDTLRSRRKTIEDAVDAATK